jgi:putative tryptophan/tyrosine transport system substrate-binding protein
VSRRLRDGQPGRRPGARLTTLRLAVTGVVLLALGASRPGVEAQPARLYRVGVVLQGYRPDSPSAQESAKNARDAARQLKVELLERPVASVEELRAGLRALRPGEADAFLYVADAMVASQAELLIESARAKRLPTMFQDRWSVAKGALAAYGESYYTIGRLSAKSVQRVLLGANPGELPVEQVDRFHFVVNLKTAKALGLTIPQALLARADEVIGP